MAACRCIQNLFKSLFKAISAKKRRNTRNRNKEKVQFLKHFAALPHQSARAFTDGSSLKAGAGGAGYTYCLSPDSEQVFASRCLGVATNNVAELSALRLLCDHIRLQLLQNPQLPRLPLFVFIDNKYTIGAAEATIKTEQTEHLLNLYKNPSSSYELLPRSLWAGSQHTQEFL
jgi:ribonuclease HI